MNRFIAMLFVLCACVPQDVCEGEGRVVSGSVTTVPPTSPVTGEVTIAGTLDEGDVTIARIWAANSSGEQVADGTAKAGALNFEQWEVKVPAAAFRPPAGLVEATIHLMATDACSGRRSLDHEIGSLTVPANPPDDTPIQDMTVAVSYPATDRCYLPVDARGEATLHVTANQASAGGLVSLQSSLIEFQAGRLDDKGRLRLSLVGGVAGEDVGIFAKTAQTGVATIRVGGRGAESKSVEVTIAAKPTLIAAAPTIVAGGKTTVIVTSGGILDTCSATTTSEAVDVSVVGVADSDLTVGSVAVGSKSCPEEDGSEGDADPSDVDEALIDVSFAEDASSNALVTLRCRDTYGQTSDALTITLTVPP